MEQLVPDYQAPFLIFQNLMP